MFLELFLHARGFTQIRSFVFTITLCHRYNYCSHVIAIIIIFFFGPHLQHIEVPRLGVELELQLPTTARATLDPSCVCGLYRRFVAAPDPLPTEGGRRWNPHPHGYYVGSEPAEPQREL